MNPSALTAAHRTLPFGSKVKVTNQRNGKSIVVRINDRGPFIKGRVIDLSKGSCKPSGLCRRGLTQRSAWPVSNKCANNLGIDLDR